MGLGAVGSRTYLLVAPTLSLFPGLAIFLLVLGFNLLGARTRRRAGPGCAGQRGGKPWSAPGGDQPGGRGQDHPVSSLVRGEFLSDGVRHPGHELAARRCQKGL